MRTDHQIGFEVVEKRYISLTEEQSVKLRSFLETWAEANRPKYNHELWRAACKNQLPEPQGWFGSRWGATIQEYACAWFCLEFRPMQRGSATRILLSLRDEIGGGR